MKTSRRDGFVNKSQRVIKTAKLEWAMLNVKRTSLKGMQPALIQEFLRWYCTPFPIILTVIKGSRGSDKRSNGNSKRFIGNHG